MPTAPPPEARGKLVPTTPNPVRQVDQHAAKTFVELVFDPSRLKPLILISPGPRHGGNTALLDPVVLHELVSEHAQIAVLTDTAASEALRVLLPDLGVWGGAARIYRPDARPEDSAQHHPLVLLPQGNPDQALAEIRDRLHRLGVVYSTSTPAPRTEFSLPAAAPVPSARDLEAENTRLKAALAERDRTMSELRRETQRLAKQLKAAEGRAVIDVPAVFADPERQFRYEVEQAWLRSTPEADRPDFPLGTYHLGPDWLDSLTTVELVDRRRIVEVTVEVLTGRAATVPGRQVHRMRARDERGARPLMRTSDQAVAMRCSLKNNTASAPRLMWWRLDDSIELGRVALHDDTQLR